MVDKVGYLSFGPDAATVPFRAVGERRPLGRPMVFTANQPIKEWRCALHSSDLVEATFGRVLERVPALQGAIASDAGSEYDGCTEYFAGGGSRVSPVRTPADLYIHVGWTGAGGLRI